VELHGQELEYVLAVSAQVSVYGPETSFACRSGTARPAAEWAEGEQAPTDYWLSSLGEDEPRERLARLARLRSTIELDHRQPKGELGLDHYEGRSYLGLHHHTALVTSAHAFLTRERLCPPARRPT
jgi:SRSO17 transposase